MIHLKFNLHNVPVAVNPLTVSYVTRLNKGCTIHFIGGGQIHVADEYDDVLKMLMPQ